MEALYPWIHLVGRLLFSVLFIMSGVNHLLSRDEMAGYARSKGVPAAGLMVPLSGVMLLAGGAMVFLGWRPAWGAALIALFLLPTAFVMHAFWKEEAPDARQNEQIHFMKDLALAGAALVILYHASEVWPFSL